MQIPNEGEDMRIGIAADHGGFGLKQDLHERLVAASHEVVDFGANTLNSGDDYILQSIVCDQSRVG